MTHILLIEKNGDICESKIKDFSIDNLYKKCRFRKPDGFENRANWSIKIDGERINVALYCKDKGKSGTENKYDLPPPVDSNLFFGPLLLVRFADDKITPMDLSSELWNKVYEKLFGGFENLDATAQEDEEEIDELADLPNEMKTKDGYLKDGFIVEDHSSNPSSVCESPEESQDDYESELDFEEYEYMDSSDGECD